jgi:diguanylate cyclase (GGDEF)-like protein
MACRKVQVQGMVRFLEKQPWHFVMTVGSILILALGFVDFWVGPEISFSLFYLIPLFLITWYAGRWPGFVAALLGAGTWLVADILAGETYRHPMVALWNVITRVTFFMSISLLLAALKQRLEQEEEHARTDMVTQVANVRSFTERLSVELERARRYKRPLTMVYMDADNFKEVNDRFGHATGDTLLLWMARTMMQNVRVTDVVARLGGDEFAILLPETNSDEAKIVVSKLRHLLISTMVEKGWPVTFSIGVVTFVEVPATAKEVIRSADDLMYVVKRSGKNAVRYQVWGVKEGVSH